MTVRTLSSLNSTVLDASRRLRPASNEAPCYLRASMCWLASLTCFNSFNFFNSSCATQTPYQLSHHSIARVVQCRTKSHKRRRVRTAVHIATASETVAPCTCGTKTRSEVGAHALGCALVPSFAIARRAAGGRLTLHEV